MDPILMDIERLEGCGAFRTRQEIAEFLMMQIMDNKEEAIGSWALKTELFHIGMDLSTATLGRYLKELDAQNYTVQVSNKGRILTEEGKKNLDTYKSKITSDILYEDVKKATNIKKYDELLELYFVRKILEKETVKIAAENMTDEALEKMEEGILQYRELAGLSEDFINPALNFHILIAEASGNSFLEAVLKMLIFEQKRMEAKFDVLVTREHGLQYSDEHEEILHAIQRKDPETASRLMGEHMDKMIQILRETERGE